MAMFGPRFYTQAEPNFSGLFRLIDEFDNYSSQQSGSGRHPQQQHQQGGRRGGFNRLQIQTFTPKFDLKETETNFELHGELPGIEKDQVQIEFTDPQTIVIRGRAERSYTAGTPPAGLIDEGNKTSGALTQEGEQQQQPATSDDASERSSLHATVEDDVEEGRSTATSTAAPTPASTAAELSKPASEKQQQQQQPQQPKFKYWVSERSVGEFSRAFQFPSRVEHDNVRASLNNGILTVTVPKAKKPESRRIAIN
ncbi:hypothetical protein SLS62_001056 [Diatrype stigma]|uniref:SHSP domain-containing protein n=1 Tax=Diatrype stigma TaxID=117547 RepID=A0AAN9YX55_9PEZI